MRRRRLLLFLLAGAVVLTVVWLAWPREHEPEYKGRKLSEWVFVAGSGVAPKGGPSQDDAVEAFSRIGTNGLPWVMKWIRSLPQPWRLKLYEKLYLMTSRLPGPFRFTIGSRYGAEAEGVLGYFSALGSRASPAIPELAGLMNDFSYPERASFAAFALTKIGAEGLPPVLALLGNLRSSSPVRETAVVAVAKMEKLGTNGTVVIGALIRCLSDPDGTVAYRAGYAIGQLALQPDLAVPALAKALQNPNADVRHAAAYAIPKFGDQARPAVPSLVKALNDPTFDVRYIATNALREIAPEVLPKEEGR
jgi:HEAT repeat protein